MVKGILLQFMFFSGEHLHTASCLARAEVIFEHVKCISMKHKLCDGFDKFITMVIGWRCMNSMELLNFTSTKELKYKSVETLCVNVSTHKVMVTVQQCGEI